MGSNAEAKSLATLQRLNDSQTLAGIDGIQRIHVGPSVDLLIRMDDDVDVGCGESSKPVKNKETDTKTLTEGGIKGPKTAQDMLAYLKHVTYDQTTTRKLKVMVLITADLNWAPYNQKEDPFVSTWNFIAYAFCIFTGFLLLGNSTSWLVFFWCASNSFDSKPWLTRIHCS
ncbi:hypothetical protein VTP01DRAFT_825 [Rhizomucor pusillus]|uniref:uncharacterized protein n=1 Tax=Rhizomucor pusillus TaxID=4840 RepID=UPI003742A0ED